MDAKALHSLAEKCFEKRGSLLSLWQEIAENFYPERADFTYRRSLGTDFASELMTSFPILVRREFTEQLPSMLRPHSREWFHMTTGEDEPNDIEGRRWLEWANKTMYRAMYDRKSQFVRATREADPDYATFGQCVLSVQLNSQRDTLLYRCWHLRDVAWMENADGVIGSRFRKWKAEARILNQLFKDTVHQNVKNIVAKEPYREINCVHMIVESEMYDGETNGKPYYSVYYDIENNHVMEAVPVFNPEYVIPRWQTVSGSQYAFSPCSVAALPEARVIQTMMATLLEAGEKAVNPPMVATQNVVRSDISVFPGGVTWVAEEYDEKLGDALRPLNQDLRGLPAGMDMHKESQRILQEAFYLNKLKPFTPTDDPQMTAFQAGQIVAQYIRDALPLFELMESEYNAQLCEATFELGMRAGLFGSLHDMPQSLRGKDVQFRFESPLHDVIEAQKGQKFLETKALLTQAAEIDPSVGMLVDARKAIRDALTGIRAPAEWQRTDGDIDEIQRQQQSQLDPGSIEQASKMIQNMDKANKAGQSIAESL